MTPRFPVATLATLAVLAAGAVRAQPAAPPEEALARRVEALADELASLKRELEALRAGRGASAGTAGAPGVPASAPMVTNVTTVPPAAAAATAAPVPSATTVTRVTPVPGAPMPAAAGGPDAAPPRADAPATVLTSYGEINYNRPRRDPSQSQADLRRFVLGFQHRFDADTKVVAEIEWEHAIASADDAGEVALEQAYVERRFGATWSGRAGLFLMPFGLINERHEPTAYYGVERNFVETAIIPSTWREGGLQAIAELGDGWTVQGGVSTGFDLTRWDATSAEGRSAPLQSIHQELSLAKARDLAAFGAVRWRGIPGLLLGASGFSGGATHGLAAASSRISLWEAHARWTPGRWDIAALYAHGSISNTAALNAPLVGSATLIPSSFEGAYLQAAYRLWGDGSQSVWPFARIERFNGGRAYADLGAGLTPDAQPDERVLTLGANWLLTEGVVLKADLQRFSVNRDADRLNLGLGWSF